MSSIVLETVGHEFHTLHGTTQEYLSLSFYGSFRRSFSLDMCCRSFGITSPKEGISGAQ